jgi:hypothetical protein
MLDELNGPQGTPPIRCISPAKELPEIPTPLLTHDMLEKITESQSKDSYSRRSGSFYQHADRTFTFPRMYACRRPGCKLAGGCGTITLSGQSTKFVKLKCGGRDKPHKCWSEADGDHDLRFFRTSAQQIIQTLTSIRLPNADYEAFKERLQSFMDQLYFSFDYDSFH